MSKRDITVERSSGNVFQDLELPEAEERLAKAMLSREFSRIVEEHGLTQTEAAEVLGAAQPDVSNIMRGRLSGYTLERLARYLNALGQDVEIRVRPKPDGEKRGRLRVSVG
jgi:predicted XRE-type DNA-binding protein